METQEDVEDHVRVDLGIEDDEGVDLYVWPFIPFTDGTQLDAMGRSKAKVGLTGFANFESDILRRPCTRELFAVFPDLQTSTAQSEAKAVITFRTKIYHDCMKMALASIKSCYAEGGRPVHCKDG